MSQSANEDCHVRGRLVGLRRAGAMSETIGERIRRYVLDSSDEDLQRLLSIAELSAEPTRTAFRKIGMKPGRG
jgi:hypothetical protein